MEYICSSSNFQAYIDFMKEHFNLTDQGEIINYLFSLKQEYNEELTILLGQNGYIEDINDKKLLVYKKEV